jgi:HD-like signal output (HDOD) protein
MGLLGSLLERVWRRTARPPPKSVAAPHPARPVAPAAAPSVATPVAPAAARDLAKLSAQLTTIPDPAQVARERELAELRRSFQHGILDSRFRELDVDQRFLDDFAQLVADDAIEFAVPPAAAFDVMRIVDDPNYPVRKVAAAIACDPSLAGSVVSLANSALHRGAVAVETLPDAIVRVGQRHLRLLLLEIALGSTRVQAKPYEVFSTLTWKHSLLTAQLAHRVAKAAGRDADHAYMAGLFHDVGTFAVLTAARSLATRQARRITTQTLLRLIEAHGNALDARVVAGWRLPEPVALAVVHRRAPHEAREAAPLAAVTALANDLARPLGAWVAARPVDLAHHPALELLQFDRAKLPAEAEILELAQMIEKVAALH